MDSSTASGRAGVQPLLQLPVDVLQLVLRHAGPAAKKSLPLACKEATALVDGSTKYLKISRRGPFKQQRAVPLAARFPDLTVLRLDAAQGWAQEFGDLIRGEQWLNVTCLTMRRLSATVCARAMRACPNVRRCTVEDSGFSFGVPEMLHCAANALPNLTSLTISHSLGDKELAALAACPSLVELDIKLGVCSSTGWTEFLTIGVRQLRVELDFDTLPPNALASWGCGMTALTNLDLRSHFNDDLPSECCLPPSITMLCLGRVTPGFAAELPHLTSFSYSGGCLDELRLRYLAIHCPALSSISVDELYITPQCHANPLTALTTLRIFGQLDTCAEACLLCAVFPRLQKLDIDAVCDLDVSPFSIYKGFTSLRTLDIGYGFGPEETYVMQLRDFQALGCLTELRLMAVPAHVMHISSLQQLQALTLVFSRDLDATGAQLSAIVEQLNTGAAPAKLQHVAVEFFSYEGCHARNLEIPCSLEQLHQQQTGLGLAALATAAPSWLLRGAPLLSHVEWEHGDYAGLTDCSLFALAAHPSMKLILLLGGLGGITPSMLHHARECFAFKGLEVTMDHPYC